MPRYHFHVHDGVDKPDPEGTELPDPESARAEALKLVGKIIMDAGIKRDPAARWVVTVTDETDQILFRMDFAVTEATIAERGS